MKKVLLYSGGLDSWLINKLWKPDHKIYVYMGTSYADKEINNIKKQKEKVNIIYFPLFQYEEPNKIIPLRNLYLLMLACNETGYEDVEICLGANCGDRIYDKTLPFAKHTEKLLNELYQPQTQLAGNKKVKINFKYKNYSKAQLLKEYIQKGGNIETAFNNTVSCYQDGNTPCWSCKNCFRKYLAFKLNGWEFSDEIHKSMFKTFEKEILPDLKQYNTLEEYGRGREGKEFLEYYLKAKKEAWK